MENISEFILDLDPACKSIKILFEILINKEKLLKDLETIGTIEKDKYIKKNIASYLDRKIYIFDNYEELTTENRFKLIKKDLSDVKKLIDFQIIHAKRDVTSSDEKKNKKILSSLTTKYFNDNTINSPDKFEEINKLIQDMDKQLTPSYGVFFESFLKNAKEFLNISELKIISDLRAGELFKDSSQVIYGNDDNYLPECFNGLGCMNILYLLLDIEIKKSKLIANNKNIKLLFIEEPEAHTHPQLQYVFARKIDNILKSVKGLQTIITTHSPHIVSQSKFKNIRYLLKVNHSAGGENIIIKNFYTELNRKYTNQDEFNFLKQYLTIESAELFFASKIIFIEGVTERMLLPYFISRYDNKIIEKEKQKKENGESIDKEFIPISSQNISVMQVGANAKVFRHFLDFLDIKTLVITDIDTTKKVKKIKENEGKETINYVSCEVNNNANATSNETIKYYFNAPESVSSKEFEVWIKEIINGSKKEITDKVKVMYQKPENGYHARSFEDAFINANYDLFREKISLIRGLKNKKKINEMADIYNLTNEILDKKSELASSLLYLALTDESIKWEIPKYIEEGLEWISK